MRNLNISILVVFGAGCTFANTIFVNNFSFETLPPGGLPASCGVPLGCSYSNADIPGWTRSNVGIITGQFQPGVPGNTTYFSAPMPDGITVAYTSGGIISQTVAATALANTIYTLRVDVGLRNDQPDFGTVLLLIGSHQILATGTAPLPGHFSTFTATYLTSALDLGASIGIQLSANSNQGDFDNVRLDSTAAPEPGTAFFVVSSFALVVPLLRRRRRIGD